MKRIAIAICLTLLFLASVSCKNTGDIENSSTESSDELNLSDNRKMQSDEIDIKQSEEPFEDQSAGGVLETSNALSEIPFLKDEDISFWEDSEYRFTSYKYPGKVLVHDKRYGTYEYYSPYPFYVIDEIIKEFMVDGKKVSVFSGRYADLYAGGPQIAERECAGILYDDCVEVTGQRADNVSVVGKVLILTNSESDGGQLYLFRAGTFESFQVDVTKTREGTEKFIVHDWMLDTAYLPDWIIIDTEGNYYSLPIPDECRWSVEKIEFDTESDDPDAVIVKYRKGDELITEHASMKDTRQVDYDDYYMYPDGYFNED